MDAIKEGKPDFEILYEEGSVLAVNKRAGLLTQAPAGIDSLEFQIKEFLIQREQKTGKCYLGIPHRLDRPASGVILFTKNSRAANKLCAQFHERSVEKFYWALVEGTIEEDTGTWNDYMRKVPGRAEAEILSPMHPDAREAILHFEVLRRFDRSTWLKIHLETGRTHQIRLQCGSRGFPLLGDTLYGSTVPFGDQFEDERLRAIALHAREISFVHPQTKEKIHLVAPVSATWTEYGIDRSID